MTFYPTHQSYKRKPLAIYTLLSVFLVSFLLFLPTGADFKLLGIISQTRLNSHIMTSNDQHPSPKGRPMLDGLEQAGSHANRDFLLDLGDAEHFARPTQPVGDQGAHIYPNDSKRPSRPTDSQSGSFEHPPIPTQRDITRSTT